MLNEECPDSPPDFSNRELESHEAGMERKMEKPFCSAPKSTGKIFR